MTRDVSSQALLQVARQAAERGAKLLVEEWNKGKEQAAEGTLRVKTKSSAIDYVTEADGKAQEVMIATIRKHFPSHRFIAEEEGADDLGHADSPFEWIIDPLDGTTNFIHGKPNFGSIVAIQKNGELLAGCMAMPLLEKMYTGAKGHGAFVNGELAHLRKTAGMTDAILASNTIHRARTDERGALQISSPLCASLQNYGCAAQELGEMLEAQNDGVFFRGIKLWDIAAGCLMVEEAGGKYQYERLEPENPRSGLLCVVSTEPIFKELCEFVFEKQLA